MIEKALFEDLEEILALQKLAYMSEGELYNDYTIEPLTQTIESIKEDYNKQTILKAIEDGEIVGSIRAYEIEGICYIGRVFVHPDYQNKGIGRKLVNSIEKHFDKCNKYSLFTGKKSLKNIKLYTSLGYNIVKEEKINEDLVFVHFEK